MGLLNYTTEIAVDKTVGEIYAMLAKARVSAVMSEYDGVGNITAISFRVTLPYGQVAYKLPANIAAAAQILNTQARARQIPAKFQNDVQQARRVAWRCIRQWVEAQLALVEIGAVSLDQAMLPYAVTPTGETVYERLLSTRFVGIAQLPETTETHEGENHE